MSSYFTISSSIYYFLTIPNGRADLVVMDAKTYQRLAEKATGTGSKSLASDRIALEMGVVAAG